MSSLFFSHALLPGGWARNVRLRVAGGLIEAVEANATATTADEQHLMALPGMPNLHSHSFQRAIAGLTESRGAGPDSFWSWRDIMYRFALEMTPDEVQAVATHAFTEMLEAGFTAVGEFHYLHHAPGGQPYDDVAEMAVRIAAAADAVGIDLTLLPVFYAHGGFGGAPPGPAQRRFISSLDQYGKLHERCTHLANTGVAPHSLRAVTPEELGTLVKLAGSQPIHIHIAEQTQEVTDCIAWSGAPPVSWLMAHEDVTTNWCLVHATHANATERAVIMASKAVVGLCPITEANLGDGIFNAHAFTGPYGIGSDSNVLIGVASELRQLEYSQRLLRQQRNVMAGDAHAATATAMFQRAVAGGAQALGQNLAGLQAGAPANVMALAVDRLGPAAATPDTALSLAVFAAPGSAVETVWVRGCKVVTAGQHRDAARHRNAFNAVVSRLLNV